MLGPHANFIIVAYVASVIVVIALVLSRKLLRLKHRPQAVQHVDSRA